MPAHEGHNARSSAALAAQMYDGVMVVVDWSFRSAAEPNENSSAPMQPTWFNGAAPAAVSVELLT